MRYSVRTLFTLTTLLALAVVALRQAWLRYPESVTSIANGVTVWIGIVLLFRIFLAGDIPRQLKGGLLAIATGLIWMIAFRLSPSLLWLFVGFLGGALTTLLIVQFGAKVLAWVGIENE